VLATGFCYRHLCDMFAARRSASDSQAILTGEAGRVSFTLIPFSSMSRNNPNRKHSARALLTVRELTRAGSSLNVRLYARGRKIGELEIGRGSLFWFGHRRRGRKRIRWSTFAHMMDELAYGK
jgi:hypothetical protein